MAKNLLRRIGRGLAPLVLTGALAVAGMAFAEDKKVEKQQIIKFDFIPDSCNFQKIKESGANIVICKNDRYTAFLSDTNGDLHMDEILWYNGRDFWSLTRRGDYFKMIDEFPEEKKVDFDLTKLEKRFLRVYREHNI